MENRKKAFQFFEFLREMIQSLMKDPDNMGEMQELTYLANYIKDMVADALQQYEVGNIPILNYTVYGSRDGKSDSRFQVARNEEIIQAWSLTKLANLINQAKDEWDKTELIQPEAENFDLTPYKVLMQDLHGKKDGKDD